MRRSSLLYLHFWILSFAFDFSIRLCVILLASSSLFVSRLGPNKVCRAFLCAFLSLSLPCVASRRKSNVHLVHRFRTTGDRTSKELPPLPADFREFQDSQDYTDEDEFYQGDESSPTFRSHDIAGDHELDGDGRPRVPLIVLAQQSDHPPPLPEPSEPGTFPARYRLSTISEKSERTEASRHWPSKQQLYAYNDPQPSSPMSSNTSYGQVIGETDLQLVR